MQDRDIAESDVAAVFQRDGFIADAGGQGEIAVATAEALAPDQSLAFDGNVLQVFAPDQAVVPVAVAEVLIVVPGVGFGRVIAAARSWECPRRRWLRRGPDTE